MAQSNQEDQMFRVPLSDDESLSQATYRAVAKAKDCDPLELPPLARTIDTDGLNALAGESRDTMGLSCTFEYAGCSVTIADGEIRIEVR